MLVGGFMLHKDADDRVDARESAEKTNEENIIRMAIGHTAMMPLFEEHSVDLILEKLTYLISCLDQISTDQEFTQMHGGFCRWFVRAVKLRRSGERPSYGQAAKVLDLALKVYVFYCKMPNRAKAESLIPRLNGVINTPMLRHLFKRLAIVYGRPFPPHYLWTINMIDEENYLLLQKLIRQVIRDSFESRIWPVQHDDVMGQHSSAVESEHFANS
jgi:hypothetical protein